MKKRTVLILIVVVSICLMSPQTIGNSKPNFFEDENPVERLNKEAERLQQSLAKIEEGLRQIK